MGPRDQTQVIRCAGPSHWTCTHAFQQHVGSVNTHKCYGSIKALGKCLNGFADGKHHVSGVSLVAISSPPDKRKSIPEADTAVQPAKQKEEEAKMEAGALR